MAGRHRLAIAVVAIALLLVPAVSTAGVYVYERSLADRILPGVRVAGIYVGGMTRSEALRAVSSEGDALLDRQVRIRVGERQWDGSFKQLGVSAGVEEAVEEAFAVSGSLSWIARAYHRLTDNPVERSITLGYRYRTQPVRSLLKQAAAELHRPARDAAVRLKDGELVFQRARKGQALDTASGVRAVMAALGSWRQEVWLPLEPVLPEVTEEGLGETITIDLSTNTLRLLDGFDVVRKYDVGTAMPGYSTPPGTWEVIDKRENPTWYNPDPDGWGADMPLTIPGGPSNPLGTRALYLDAPGIRVHGTPATDSVGFYVSHGCIRMRMWEVEELYPLVPIGTPVLVFGSPPWGIVEDPGTPGT
ncbi:MAG: L,D-transpeptidase family protein [Actinomycetota bacterium]